MHFPCNVVSRNQQSMAYLRSYHADVLIDHSHVCDVHVEIKEREENNGVPNSQKDQHNQFLNGTCKAEHDEDYGSRKHKTAAVKNMSKTPKATSQRHTSNKINSAVRKMDMKAQKDDENLHARKRKARRKRR